MIFEFIKLSHLHWLSPPPLTKFRCNGTYGEASLGNSSEDTWMNSSDFFFASNFVRSHSSNYVANHGDNSADEFPFDCSFLGDASESEDLKISQDDYYKHDYEGLVFSMGTKHFTE